jgi:hypothetical protein
MDIPQISMALRRIAENDPVCTTLYAPFFFFFARLRGRLPFHRTHSLYSHFEGIEGCRGISRGMAKACAKALKQNTHIKEFM